ncbi:HAD-IC family P-type ATPase [Methanococcoides methylutens]|uniref:Ca ion P-type ATPase n=1 Tax=Methanococcoides methylutens MM1 TaxID=1434104 RepID=A0A0E3SSG1_METMT|nr:HAD-IC family P-type ATPase [Methanococcoides methylutens]AKB85332.1 Ca ion P-type ATPase [Methanococcoides methylutens MM1]
MSGEIKWYRVPVDEVLTLLDTDKDGITDEEAQIRLSKYGFNEVEVKEKESSIHRFARQFASPLIYVLLAASLVTFILEEYADMAVILGVVLANAVIGFIQERNAENALESLAKMLVPETSILRDGKRMIIHSRELVAGDIVLLEAGNRIPADLRLMYVKNLRIDESMLTGESTAVEKIIDSIETKSIPIAEQKNIAFGGTLVTQGSGLGVVVATGPESEIGKISELIRKTENISTPLVRTIDQLAKTLAIVILGLSIFTFIVGKLRGFDNLDIFFASVSLAVAAIPEGLPALITISLAFGIKRMASRNAIIRTMPSVESLGSATVICSDKTGTLTKNEMTVKRIYTLEGEFDVTGVGYNTEGDFELEGKTTDPMEHPALMKTLKAGTLCNDAYLREEGGIDGDPTEGALLVSAAKAGKFYMQRVDTIPFESEERYMATLHQDEDKNSWIYVKGSPEKLVELCSHQFNGKELSPIDPEMYLEAAEKMASEGLRVIGTAYRKLEWGKDEITEEDVKDLIFLGLQGMIDPPREEVKTSIFKCNNAGIRVIMITGDHILTGHTIARQLGIRTNGALSGSDIQKMSDEELTETLKTVSVFARTSPEDKSRIVGLLKQQGEVVAVTGDGINDAPALENADIGVAMGRTGTEVAKDASDMVLADDNFASIVNAVEEGRNVYNKIQKVILWTLPTNAAEGLAVLAAVILGLKNPPLIPLHILWINTITALGLGVPITLEPMEKKLLNRPPRPPKEPLLLPVIKQRIVAVALLVVTATFLLYFFEMMQNGRDSNTAQTIALNTIVFFEIFYLFSCKSIHENVFRDLLSNKFMLAGIALVLSLQVFITYSPTMNSILRTSPLEIMDWVIIALTSSSVFFLIELDKYIKNKRKTDQVSN